MDTKELKELADNVINPITKQLFLDALKCSDNDQYRASIVMLWICVFYDLMMKIKELGDSGINSAKQYFEKFESHRNKNDTKNLSKIESEIIEEAFSLSMISSYEKEEIERLREDRNKCAHVIPDTNDNLYEPEQPDVEKYLFYMCKNIFIIPVNKGKNATEITMHKIRNSDHYDDYDLMYGYIFTGQLERDSDYQNELMKLLIKECSNELNNEEQFKLDKLYLSLLILFNQGSENIKDNIRRSLNFKLESNDNIFGASLV